MTLQITLHIDTDLLHIQTDFLAKSHNLGNIRFFRTSTAKCNSLFSWSRRSHHNLPTHYYRLPPLLSLPSEPVLFLLHMGSASHDQMHKQKEVPASPVPDHAFSYIQSVLLSKVRLDRQNHLTGSAPTFCTFGGLPALPTATRMHSSCTTITVSSLTFTPLRILNRCIGLINR